MHSSRSPVASSLSSTLSPATSFPASGPLPVFDLDDLRDQGQVAAAGSFARLADWVEEIDRRLQLPATFQSFALVCVGLLLFVAGAFMHLLLSVQILETKVQLAQLREEYNAIEQRNGETVFLIARETNLARLRERVVAQGYVPITARQYIFQDAPPESAQPAQTPLAQQAPETPAPTPSDQSASQPLANWQRWEAFLGLGNSNAAQSTASEPPRSATSHAAWDAWWQRTLEQGNRLLEGTGVREAER